jgi:hypothetical protein
MRSGRWRPRWDCAAAPLPASVASLGQRDAERVTHRPVMLRLAPSWKLADDPYRNLPLTVPALALSPPPSETGCHSPRMSWRPTGAGGVQQCPVDSVSRSFMDWAAGMRIRQVAALGIVFVLVLVLGVDDAAAGVTRGGFGRVTLDGVGPLQFGTSEPSDLGSFAGRPDRVDSLPGYSSPTTSYSAEDLSYAFPNHGAVEYYFVNPNGYWVLAGFETTLQRFHTARGTHTGMALGTAERREGIRQTTDTCIGPSLLRRGRGREVALETSRSRVTGLFALGPYQFAFC